MGRQAGQGWPRRRSMAAHSSLRRRSRRSRHGTRLSHSRPLQASCGPSRGTSSICAAEHRACCCCLPSPPSPTSPPSLDSPTPHAIPSRSLSHLDPLRSGCIPPTPPSLPSPVPCRYVQHAVLPRAFSGCSKDGASSGTRAGHGSGNGKTRRSPAPAPAADDVDEPYLGKPRDDDVDEPQLGESRNEPQRVSLAINVYNKALCSVAGARETARGSYTGYRGVSLF